MVSQRSTGSFAPFSPRDSESVTAGYDPGSSTTVSLWKTRLTVPKSALDQSATVQLEILSGGGIVESGDLQLIAPIMRVSIKDMNGQVIPRPKIRRDLTLEFIVDRFVDKEYVAGLLVFNFGTKSEERWLINPQDIIFAVAEDASRTISFPSRESDFVVSLAAVRPSRLPAGWGLFSMPPKEVANLTLSNDGTSDHPSQLMLNWSASPKSPIGYRVTYAYAPISRPGCIDPSGQEGGPLTPLPKDPQGGIFERALLQDLTGDQAVYVQLCTVNNRTPPDVSEGVVATFWLPRRSSAKPTITILPEINWPNLQLQINRDDASFYRYALIQGDSPCNSTTDSDWRSVTEPLIETLAAEGPYVLCLTGKLSDFNQQKDPSAYAFRVDRTPPGSFLWSPPSQTLTDRKPTLTWTAASGAVAYDVTVATDNACQIPVHKVRSNQPSLQDLTIRDGSYHFCIEALDAAGNRTVATGHGGGFTVDATPPGNFSISHPSASATLFVRQPTMTWTSASDSQVYHLKIGTDATCSQVVQSQSNITTTSVTLSQPLGDGSYYLCLTAADSAGNQTKASNDGLPFAVNTGHWSTRASAGQSLPPREKQLAVWAPNYGRLILWGGESNGTPQEGGAFYDLAPDTWDTLPPGNSPQPARSGATAAWDPARHRVVIWGGHNSSQGLLASGAILHPGQTDPTGDPWIPMAQPDAPSGRRDHTGIVTGDYLVVWGGRVCALDPLCAEPTASDTGGLYHIPTNTWQPNGTNISDPDRPSPRYRHSAVWTGTEMLIWGGFDGTSQLRNGARFALSGPDPWKPISLIGAPSAREDHAALWTGTRLLIWGGFSCSDPPACQNRTYYNDGGLYDPVTDTWTSVSTVGAPAARRGFAYVWDDVRNRMIVWGGRGVSGLLGDGAIFDPTAGWIVPAISTGGAPSNRADGAALWTGQAMLIYGGVDSEPKNTLYRYTPP